MSGEGASMLECVRADVPAVEAWADLAEPGRASGARSRSSSGRLDAALSELRVQRRRRWGGGGNGPAFLVGTRFFDDTTITSYFEVVPSLEAGTPVSLDGALEVGGPAKLFAVEGLGWLDRAATDSIRGETGLVVIDTRTDQVERVDVDGRRGGITRP